MVERACPNCGKAYQTGDEACRFCGYVFPFSTVELSRGTLLHSRYEVQELIHIGGNGYVYLARDKTLFDRPCIVKQIREPIRSEEHRRKLEEEALRMASLNNPNIAMILDHFIENGRYFLIVERIRGKTLLETFRERQVLPKEEEVVKWAVDICDVISYIHKEGIIHRDISPDNIMLTDEGAVKFIDFGTLREFRHVVTGGTAGMGKYGYTPPEQWQGRPELRSDIFALGATIYYLLTGFLPLSRELTTGQPPQREDFYPRFPPVRMKNPKVSSRLEIILQKALQLDVADRFASAAEIRQALKNLEPVTQPASRIPARKFNFRSRKALAIMGAAAAGVIGIVLFLTLRGESSNMLQIPAHVPVFSYSGQTTDTPSERVTAASQYTTTLPVFDGVLSPGEWSTGFSRSFKYMVDDVSKDSGVMTVHFMNDSTELYVAIEISAPDFKESMFENDDFWFQAYITYDGNGDGMIKPGERFRGFEKVSWDSGKMSIVKTTYKTMSLTDDGYLSPVYNEVTYGTGADGYHEPTHSYIYECSIPLNCGEEKELNARPGDSLSINIIVYQYFWYRDSYSRHGEIAWPGSGGVIDIDSYGRVALAPAPGISPQASSTITETPYLKWIYNLGDTGICAPVIGLDGTVFTASADLTERTTFLYAVNPDGSLKWKQDIYEMPAGIAAAPDGTIYISSYIELTSFKPDGSKKWSYPIEYNASPPVIGTDGTVYITSSEGFGGDHSDSYLYAINPDGSLKWKYKIDKPGVSSPAVSTDGTVYVCSTDSSDMEGELLAISHTGSLKWHKEITYSNVQSLAAGVDGSVYLGTNEGVKAFNADGSAAWTQQFYCDYVSLCVGLDGSIYAYVMPNRYMDDSGSENLYCISQAGAMKWKRDLGVFEYNDQTSFHQYPAPATGPDGTIYVGCMNDNLYAFGPDGSLKWSFSLKAPDSAPPTPDDYGLLNLYGPSAATIGVDGTIYIGGAKALHAIGVKVAISTSSPDVQQ